MMCSMTTGSHRHLTFLCAVRLRTWVCWVFEDRVSFGRDPLTCEPVRRRKWSSGVAVLEALTTPHALPHWALAVADSYVTVVAVAPPGAVTDAGGDHAATNSLRSRMSLWTWALGSASFFSSTATA